MQISVMFNDYEEMVAFANKLATGATVVEATKGSKAKDIVKKPTPSDAKEPITDTPKDVKDEVPFEEEEKTYTLEEVRAALAVVTRKGKQKEVKELLTSFGAKNLSGVDAKDYAALMEKAGAI